MLISTSYFSYISDLMGKHGRSEKNMYNMFVVKRNRLEDLDLRERIVLENIF